MDIQRATLILSNCHHRARSVSELMEAIRGNHGKVLDSLRVLEVRGLVSSKVEKNRRGRPQRKIVTTPLGEQFLKQYKALMNLRVHCNANDIKRAIHQAQLARSLAAQGISAYARFSEMNEIARNIARTAQTGKCF